MARTKFDPVVSIKLLNEHRVRFLNQPLTRVEVGAIFYDCKLPTSLFNFFLKSDMITRKEYGTYMFTRRTPIYIGELKALHETSCKYYRDKMNGVTSPSEEEKAIEFLKSLGYKIFKEI